MRILARVGDAGDNERGQAGITNSASDAISGKSAREVCAGGHASSSGADTARSSPHDKVDETGAALALRISVDEDFRKFVAMGKTKTAAMRAAILATSAMRTSDGRCDEPCEHCMPPCPLAATDSRGGAG